MRQGGSYIASAKGKAPKLVSRTQQPEPDAKGTVKQEKEADAGSKKAPSSTEKSSS